MKLLMYIENDFIDEVVLEHDKVILPGYIGDYIRMLREKHSSVILESAISPEFLVQHFVV